MITATDHLILQADLMPTKQRVWDVKLGTVEHAELKDNWDHKTILGTDFEEAYKKAKQFCKKEMQILHL